MMSQAVTTKRHAGIDSPTISSSDTQALTLLIFKVAEQQYGLPVTDVIRIIEMVTITHLPSAPDIIKGIINLHGKAVPVIDLRQRLGLPVQSYGLHTPIILVDIGNEHILGLVVDAVELVSEIPAQDLEVIEAIVPTQLSGLMASNTAFLAGVAKTERQMIVILDVQALLQPAEQAKLLQAIENEG